MAARRLGFGLACEPMMLLLVLKRMRSGWMWMRLPLGLVGLIWMFFFLSPPGVLAQGSGVSTRSASAKGVSDSGFQFSIGTGLGLFQDMQVPESSMPGIRADGTRTQVENADHLGFPIAGTFGGELRFGRLSYDASLAALYMPSIEGPPQSSFAAYGRFNLGAGLTARLAPQWSSKPWVAGHGMVRKSVFTNVSSGHYLNSAVGRISAGANLAVGWNLEVYGGRAPVTSFGYVSGVGSGVFPGSEASLWEAGGRISFHATRRIQFDFSADEEAIDVVLPNMEEGYRSFGLAVAPTYGEPIQRSYQLRTRIFKIGYTRSF